MPITRRELIALIGGAAAAWPRVAFAQRSAAMPVIGFLNSVARDEDGRGAFRKGLAELGYLEGKNVAIEYRDADGIYDQLPFLAAELASLPVSLIVAVPSSPAALAAKRATSAIPIVFFVGVDPVRIRLVASYNRPGGNATGVALNSDEMTAKRFELLRELLPESVRLALLVNPSNPNARSLVATDHRQLWVKTAVLRRPVEPAPDKQTFSEPEQMSHRCHERKWLSSIGSLPGFETAMLMKRGVGVIEPSSSPR